LGLGICKYHTTTATSAHVCRIIKLISNILFGKIKIKIIPKYFSISFQIKFLSKI
jgi:hypothetical protein